MLRRALLVLSMTVAVVLGSFAAPAAAQEFPPGSNFEVLQSFDHCLQRDQVFLVRTEAGIYRWDLESLGDGWWHAEVSPARGQDYSYDFFHSTDDCPVKRTRGRGRI